MSKRIEKKRKQKKAILMATLATAAVIVGGMTFAWYSSSDSVTNRLTAQGGDFDVKATETFTPPKTWQPGQSVNKDVYVVNTGNSEAHVEVDLKSVFKVYQKKGDLAINDSNLAKALYLGGVNADGTSTDQMLKEAAAIEAGGYMVVEAGTIAGTEDAVTLIDDDDNIATPTQSDKGLYIFRRAVDYVDSAAVYAYSGYYTDGSNNYYELKTKDLTLSTGKVVQTVDGITTSNGLVTNTDNVKLIEVEKFYTDEKTASNKNITTSLQTIYYKEATDTANADIATSETAGYTQRKALKVIYGGATNATTDDTIVWVVFSDKYDTDWVTTKATGTEDTYGNFYYGSVLGSGATSEKLVDAIVMDKSVTQKAFLTLDYELTVNVNSVQAVKTEDGKYTADAISTIAGTDVNVAAANGNLTAAG